MYHNDKKVKWFEKLIIMKTIFGLIFRSLIRKPGLVVLAVVFISAVIYFNFGGKLSRLSKR